jgi:hypothetical protein
VGRGTQGALQARENLLAACRRGVARSPTSCRDLGQSAADAGWVCLHLDDRRRRHQRLSIQVARQSFKGFKFLVPRADTRCESPTELLDSGRRLRPYHIVRFRPRCCTPSRRSFDLIRRCRCGGCCLSVGVAVRFFDPSESGLPLIIPHLSGAASWQRPHCQMTQLASRSIT